MNEPFFKTGLKFICMQCSDCCRLSPGYVFLSSKDLKKLSRAFNIDCDEIIKQYCRIININGVKRVSLKEKPNFDCIFWENSGCSIYRIRPIQCRSFPFWSTNIDSKLSWENLAKHCPGAGKGPVHSKKTIIYWLKRRLKEGFITVTK